MTTSNQSDSITNNREMITTSNHRAKRMTRLNLAFAVLIGAAVFLQACEDGIVDPTGGAVPAGTGTRIPGGVEPRVPGSDTLGEYKVVYTTHDGNEFTVALANADGSDYRQLMKGDMDYLFPTVSPNGRQVAVQAWRNTTYGIDLVNIDGSNAHLLVADGATPMWSPDGTKIVYTSKESGNPDIWMINADGSGKRQLTTDRGRDFHPCWSPDGRMIAFASDREQGGDRLFVMSADGSNQRRVTSNFYSNSAFQRSSPWSSDSRRLVYTGEIDSRYGVTHLFVVNADGTAQRQVTSVSLSSAHSPCWSPDGTSIAFVGKVDYRENLFVINADGSGQRRVTTVSSSDIGCPDWSPDGKRIVFKENDAIMTASADGSSMQRVSEAGARRNEYPLWSPVRIP